ncbi:hypothetical protein HD597_002560 [Nonomuraea thailandensis]|uniref:P-type ATPase A domain-containing protein n=1 Tax=Nonomuraea thailandensis TaxID=1188745 RepID=A0A9X2K116_9ACTN|nr:cation-transporting P-type ATPase [Nonomuraea thailandensis]MCP2355540.1 hypothetical protein [Nonomuraea thailandensis]
MSETRTPHHRPAEGDHLIEPDRTPWHALPAGEVAALLQAAPEQGLSAGEAARRLGRHGPDRLREAARERVPADGRLLSAASLEVRESELTGEAQPVAKSATGRVEEEAPPADRANALFMNTSVTRGRGEMLVTATGMATETGRIAGLLASAKPAPTPLQRQISTLSRTLALISAVVVAVVGAPTGSPAAAPSSSGCPRWRPSAAPRRSAPTRPAR